MAYSYQRATSDGTMTFIDVSIDYLDRSEISVYFDDVLTALWSWSGVVDNRILFSPTVPNGTVVEVRRITDASQLRHVFSQGAAFTAKSLDEDLRQALHMAQEASEANLVGDFFTDINMHGFRVYNVGPAVSDNDVLTLAQYKADNTAAYAYAQQAIAAAADAEAAADEAAATSAAAVAAFQARLANAGSPADGDALIAVKAPYTGAAAITQHDKNKQVYSTLDFTGVTDQARIQVAIDEAPPGTTIKFDPNMVVTLVKATGALPAVYTHNEQPCLTLYQKSGITLDGQGGATLNVLTHGLGALDILECTDCRVTGFNIVGAASGSSFPPLDGTTGRSEKGVVGQGYYDAAAEVNGPPRNFSVDTSAYTAGGYGGAFPQFGGGTASTWGKWRGGGYIANFGSGIFVGRGSTRITIDRCNISYFNGNGVEIDSTIVESYGWAAPGRVDVVFNNIHHCYDAGVVAHRASGVLVGWNEIDDNGHPDASITHAVIDPGYGIASNNGTAPKYVKYVGNTIRRNKRKGIDAHSIDTAVMIGNTIEDSGYGIMAVNGSLGGIRNLVIQGNVIQRIAYCASAQAAGIYVERNASGDAGYAGNVSITGNVISEVGVPPANANVGTFAGTDPFGLGIQMSGTLANVTCVGNSVNNPTYLGFIGISIGFGGTDAVNGTFSANNVQGKFKVGMLDSAAGGTGNVTVDNRINLVSISPYTAQIIGMQGLTDRQIRANVTVPPGALKSSGCFQGVTIQLVLSLVSGVLTTTYLGEAQKHITSVATDPLGIRVTLNNASASGVRWVASQAAKPVAGASTPIDYIYTDTGAGTAFLAFQVANVAQNGNNCSGRFNLFIDI